MTAEELLMSEESEAFEYSNVITIDRESRAINVPLGQEMFGVEGDKNATLKHFSCPKIVGDNIDLDLSEHNLYANYTLADEKGNPKSEDVIQSPCENIVIGDDNIAFDWKISEWVTKEDGYIAFSIVAKKSVDGVLETRWYTTPAVGRILKTVKEGRYLEQQYPDVIDNLMNRVSDLERILANGGGTGGSIAVDNALSETSTNPVQNKVVTAEVRRLSEEIVDKATLENGVIKFYKSGEIDKELFTVDISSIGGSGGGCSIELIAKVTTTENVAEIVVEGIDTDADVLSIRLYNCGDNCGNGLYMSINKNNYVAASTGTNGGNNVNYADTRAWLYKSSGKLLGKSIMKNLGVNTYDFGAAPETINSISIKSPYNDGESKYFQSGTIVEIYEGVFPNVT